MKILHTSDWHIGHNLYDNNRAEEFNLFKDWLLETINKNKIDTLIVSGDIFDVSSPSNEALSIYYNLLISLNSTSCKNAFIIAGNHDSPGTLEAPKEILKHLNINVVGKLPEDISDIIFEVSSDKQKAVIACIPYLREKDIRKTKSGESSEEKLEAIRQGISNVFKNVAEITKEQIKENIPVIATGHLYVNGSKPSDTEREIQIGNLAGVSVNKFPNEISYYAFGHIHKPQEISTKPLMYYSGSPIALSFGEAKYDKKIFVLELDGEKVLVSEIIVPRFRDLISIKGSYNDIRNKIESLNFSKDNIETWIEINIEEENEIPLLTSDSNEFITDFNKKMNAKIIKQSIKYKNNEIDFSKIYTQTESLEDLKVKDVFDKLIDSKNLNKEEQKNITEYFNELYQEFEEDVKK